MPLQPSRPATCLNPAEMIRILIADDHAIVRAGLKQFIADQLDMEVAGEAATGTEAIAAGTHAGVRRRPARHLDAGQERHRHAEDDQARRPELPVLMLSAYAEDQYAVNLLRAGAAGYLNKEAASTQLVGAIRTVVQGRKFVSPSLAQMLAEGVSGNADGRCTGSFRSASSRSSASWRRARRCRRSPTSSICPSRRSALTGRAFWRRWG